MAPSRSQNSKESGNPEVHSGQRFIGQLKDAKGDRRSRQLLCWKNCLQPQRCRASGMSERDPETRISTFNRLSRPRMVLTLSEIGISVEQRWPTVQHESLLRT